MTQEITLSQTNTARTATFTVADGLLLLIVALAAVMRFVGLGALPLNWGEATQALAAYEFWQTAGTTASTFSPAYANLTTLLTAALDGTDATVRIVPALFGVALIFLPWLLRRELGSVGALVASLLLAASPLTAIVARTAGGDAIALFAGFLLFISWVNYAFSAESKHCLTAYSALALGLISSPLFYSFLAALGMLWLAQKLVGPHFAKATAPIDTQQQRVFAAGAAGVALLLATLFFTQPIGLGATANLPVQWLQQFGLGTGWALPIFALLRYEIVLVVFGIVAIIWSTWQGSHFGMWLVYWLIGGLLVIFVQAGERTNALLIVVPLCLLVGLFCQRQIEKIEHPSVPTFGLAYAFWGLMALVNFGRFVRLADSNFGPLYATLLILLLLSAVTLTVTSEFAATGQAILLGLFAVGIFFMWGTGWRLTHETGNHPRELWVAEGTDHDIRLLRETLQESSYQLSSALTTLDLVSTIDSPVMRWYLRDFTNVTYGNAPAGVIDGGVIGSADTPPLNADFYTRTDFDFMQTGLAEDGTLDENPIPTTLRWYFFGESRQPLIKERVGLWLNLSQQQ